jgi:S-DNA-T family DNA segregation ATPase FtsK/SpoIIIE
MELTLTVQPPASPAVDVDMSVDADRSVRDLVEALAKATGVPPTLSEDMSMYLPLRDAWLSNDLSVSQAHLRVGEVVVLGRHTPSSSVVMGDIVEKSLAAKNSRTSLGSSPFELTVVSGPGNGTRFGLNANSIVIVDRIGRVRVADAKTLARQSEAQQGSVPGAVEFEGITQLDAAACLVECDRSIHVTPIAGDTKVEVRALKERTELDEHAMVVLGGIQLFVKRKVVDEPLHVSERGIVGINRPPRDVQPPTEHMIHIEAPPRDPQKGRISPVMVVVPVIAGLVMWQLFDSIAFLAMMFLSPVMMIAQASESKRTGKKEFKVGKAKFIADINRAVEDLRIGRRKELAVRRIVFPDATDCVSRVIDGRHDLWDRRRDDVDFLALRVGVGDQTALVSAIINGGGSDNLRDFGERKLRRTDPIHLAPLAVPLPQYGAIGLVGDRAHTRDVMSWLLLQITTLQSHRDVSVCAALGPELVKDYEFLKWIPHVRHGGAELDEPTVAFGQENSVVLFQKIRALIESRQSQTNAALHTSFTQWPSVVVFIDESVVRERTSIDQILKSGPAVGVFVIFLASQFRDLPGECRAVVEVAMIDPAHSQVSLSYPGSGQPPMICEKESVTLDVMNNVAQMIASMRDVTASVSSGGGGSLPKGVRLLDVLDLSRPTPEAIIHKWQNSPESLQAVLGMSTDGVLRIDMRADGPHALVAGTTGAGKSELLQTFVASMATNYSPQQVNFLFVDYKGGTAFADCATIPHSVGMVTDLDEYLAQRVLTSLNAELKRRESLLREFGAKDLITLEKKFPEQCPPSLLIVIDEFAALVREVPDFVEGVVDIAQRGRSLGLHLILATQRPAGVVNDNIRANTNMRIALRIADSSDSNDVIGTDEAARIPRSIPGRAFIRRGPSDLQAFQTAYGGDFTIDRVDSGEVADAGAPAVKAPISVNPFSLLKVIEVHHEDDLEVLVTEDEYDPSQDSDLKFLCNVIKEAAAMLRLPAPRQPWKAPLASVIPLHTIGDMSLLDANDPGRRVILGVMDLPHMQDQQTYVHDFESDGNIFIYGTSSAGKTTTLRTIAGSLAVSSSPSDCVIFAIDCASGGLECLRDLPHCANVITTRDAEGLAHFLTRMTKEVEARKETFRSMGVASIGEYRNHMRNNAVQGPVLPRIVILLDSFAGYQAAFEKVEYGAWIDAIQRLTSDGRPLGIHLVITADRRGAIPFNMAGLVEQKLIMRMADPDELSSLGVPHKVAKEIKLAPGRALLRGELEIQIPIVSDEPDGASQASRLVAIAQKLKGIYGDVTATKVQSLPEQIALSQIAQSSNPMGVNFAIAVHDSGMIPCGVDFNRGHFVISGPRATGKTSALGSITRVLQTRVDASDIYVFTPRPNILSTIPGLHQVAVGAIACEAQLNELSQRVMNEGESLRDIYVIVDDCEDLADGGFSLSIENVMRSARQKLHVVAAGDPGAFTRAYSGWLAEVKKPKSGILFKPDPQADGEILGVKLRILPGQTFPPGRGFLCQDREAIQVQVGM